MDASANTCTTNGQLSWTAAASCAGLSFAAGVALARAFGNYQSQEMTVVTDIVVYPIKSCKGVRVPSAVVTPRGLEGDRLLMVTTLSGAMLTQRQMPAMATIRPFWNEDGDLVISAPSQPDFILPKHSLTKGDRKQVTVWGHTCENALDMGDDVAAWFSAALGKGGLRLVRMPDDHKRLVEKGHVKKDGVHQTSFSDGYPFLMTSENSLNFVKQESGHPELGMDRFRPNIVVRGYAMDAFEEDRWDEVMIGSTGFECAKRCHRCQVPRVNPATGRPNDLSENEPTNTLNKHTKNHFGVNLVAHNFGHVVSVGDTVSVLEHRAQSIEGGGSTNTK